MGLQFLRARSVARKLRTSNMKYCYFSSNIISNHLSEIIFIDPTVIISNYDCYQIQKRLRRLIRLYQHDILLDDERISYHT